MGEYYVIRSGETDELYHYGVKGMKWGVRRSQKTDNILAAKKQAYKQAKKDYNKSFNNAYKKAGGAYSFSKKKRRENDERWKDAANKAEILQTKKQEYKQAKTGHKSTSKEIQSEQRKNAMSVEYKRKKAETKKLRNAARGAMVAGLLMRGTGRYMYDLNKAHCTNGQLAAINALGYGSKMMTQAGQIGIGASYIKQFSDYDKYRKQQIAELYR